MAKEKIFSQVLRSDWEQRLQGCGGSITVGGTSSLFIPAEGMFTSSTERCFLPGKIQMRAKLSSCKENGLPTRSALDISTVFHCTPVPPAAQSELLLAHVLRKIQFQEHINHLLGQLVKCIYKLLLIKDFFLTVGDKGSV